MRWTARALLMLKPQAEALCKVAVCTVVGCTAVEEVVLRMRLVGFERMVAGMVPVRHIAASVVEQYELLAAGSRTEAADTVVVAVGMMAADSHGQLAVAVAGTAVEVMAEAEYSVRMSTAAQTSE